MSSIGLATLVRSDTIPARRCRRKYRNIRTVVASCDRNPQKTTTIGGKLVGGRRRLMATPVVRVSGSIPTTVPPPATATTTTTAVVTTTATAAHGAEGRTRMTRPSPTRRDQSDTRRSAVNDVPPEHYERSSRRQPHVSRVRTRSSLRKSQVRSCILYCVQVVCNNRPTEM